MLEQLEADRLENGALFARTVTHAGLLRSFVQEFPLGTLMGLTGESIDAVQRTLGGWFFDIGAWETSVQALERELAASPSPAEARAIEHKLDKARSRTVSSDPSASR